MFKEKLRGGIGSISPVFVVPCSPATCFTAISVRDAHEGRIPGDREFRKTLLHNPVSDSLRF